MTRLVAAIVLAGAGTAAHAVLRLPAPRVVPAPGWHVITTGDNPQPPSAAVLTAATIPLAHDPDGAAGLPHWAIAHLPPSGIVVQALNYGAVRPSKRVPPLRLPLAIRGLRLLHGFEGVSARYAYFVVGPGRVHGFQVGVYVWFGRAHPTAAQRARAGAEVRRLRFPS